MPPQNRLAPPSQNALAYSVPVPFDAGMLPPPPPTFVPRRELENLSIGLGRGFVTGLEGTKQMLTQPVVTAKALIEAARQLSDDPRIVLEMLREARRRAGSGALGLGELIGENVTPGARTRSPNMVRMGGPEDFMRRREGQLIADETKESAESIEASDVLAHQQYLRQLMRNKNWIDRTQKQANVIEQLEGLGLPLGTKPNLYDWRVISENLSQAGDVNKAFFAEQLIKQRRQGIDEGFSQYLSAVREYRNTLNPRSKYDRETIKKIDSILGDTRVTQMKRD